MQGPSENAPVEQVEPGESQFAAGLGDPGQVIVPAGVEEAVLGQRAGGDDPHHRALDRPPFG